MKYKILITNHGLERYRGSEIYCYYLAKELSKNHDIYVYSPKYGNVSEKMKKFAKLLDEPSGNFDIIFYNHNNTFNANFKAKCIVYTIHGIFPPLEKPVLGCDAYVVISNEIKNYYEKLNPVYIPNGIDVEKYDDNNKKHLVKRLLFLSNYKSKFSTMLWFIALSLGMRFKRVGGSKKKAKFEIVDDLNWADVVVGVGRSALDAMSCGKKIIIADKRNYADYGMDGFLTPENVSTSSDNNFTGRAFKKKINLLSLRKEIKMAIKDKKKWERNYIIKKHNISIIANKYLDLAEKIMSCK